ncbi:hypothetical protein [Lactococcus petauri]|uniref:hypothetical protein n=1 Tax=Lactococcus petauri TaxID=1940789 RepID=UPI003852FB63
MITNNCKDLIEVLEVLKEALNQFELLKMKFLGEVQRKINRRACSWIEKYNIDVQKNSR